MSDNNEKKVINIENAEMIKELKSYLPEDLKVSSASLNKSIEESKERNRIVDNYELSLQDIYQEKYNVNPLQCCNSVCRFYNDDNYCCDISKSKIMPIGCSHRMINDPPSKYNYFVEYIPSHQEALDMLEKHKLLSGEREKYEKASIYYNKATSSTERENTEIKGVTMAQLELVIENVLNDSLNFIKEDFISIEEWEKFKSHLIDKKVISKNCSIEVEKIMGIFPNIKIR